jgi:hypothetical protein
MDVRNVCDVCGWSGNAPLVVSPWTVPRTVSDNSTSGAGGGNTQASREDISFEWGHSIPTREFLLHTQADCVQQIATEIIFDALRRQEPPELIAAHLANLLVSHFQRRLREPMIRFLTSEIMRLAAQGPPG